MGLVPIISSTYGDRAIAVLQILRDFDDFDDTKTAHQLERLARLRVVDDAEAREAATGVGLASASLTFRFDQAQSVRTRCHLLPHLLSKISRS